MNFFNSVFSENPESSNSQTTPPSSPKSQSPHPQTSSPSSNPNANPTPKLPSITNAWTFGTSLIKTLASKSESVIETYRRDFEEFGSGLRKETEVIREVASRAVKDLPTSLEAGAAAAQESLESVGQAVDNLGTTVTEIIVHGKELILAGDYDSDISDSEQISSIKHNLDSNSKPYSRINAQIRAIQCDMNTYCVEPEDLDEYNEWKLGFVLDERGEEIEGLVKENGVIGEIYNEIVPNTVDHETFWRRYFYRVYKLKKVEEARAKFVKRAISGEEDEDLSWDVEDDEYEESDGSNLKGGLKGEGVERDSSMKNVGKSKVENEEQGLKKENDDGGSLSEFKRDSGVDRIGTFEGSSDESESSVDKLGVKSDDKMTLEGNTDNGGSCKDSDFSVVSSQPLPEEEDLGWDEIEDIGSNDEIKVAASGSSNRADLRNRLNAADKEEDITWDIEDDDDEPVVS